MDDVIDQFSSEVLIVVTTYNRPDITGMTLKNLTDTKRQAGLWVMDDMSSEYSLDELKAMAPKAHRVENRDQNIGIDRQRFLAQLEAFDTKYKYIYHTDNDAIHDPDWLTRLYQIETFAKDMPICLYNTIFHMQHSLEVKPELAVDVRKFCPGISFFYKQDLIRPKEKEIKELVRAERLQTNWDFYFGYFIATPTVTSLVSYVEHFGAGGIHNQDFDRDRALSPTPWLFRERPKVIKSLTGQIK